MSADKSFDQWRRDQQMTRVAANDVTVTANPTEADSDIAPQTCSSRAQTPDATVTANPLEADSGIDVTVTANPLEADSVIPLLVVIRFPSKGNSYQDSSFF